MVFVSQTITTELLSTETETIRLLFKQWALRENDKVLVLRHHLKQYSGLDGASSNVSAEKHSEFHASAVDIQFQKWKMQRTFYDWLVSTCERLSVMHKQARLPNIFDQIAQNTPVLEFGSRIPPPKIEI